MGLFALHTYGSWRTSSPAFAVQTQVFRRPGAMLSVCTAVEWTASQLQRLAPEKHVHGKGCCWRGNGVRYETMPELKFPSPYSVFIRLLPFLCHQLDHVIDAQDGDGSFCGKLERLHFGHGGLQHASLLVVPYHTRHQVQPHPVQHNAHVNTYSRDKAIPFKITVSSQLCNTTHTSTLTPGIRQLHSRLLYHLTCATQHTRQHSLCGYGNSIQD